ncbi:MAG: L-threonylcarbamoyladenylate synthase [Tissierellia bacterium]|nr:L-threonylcarbamoyladenylate synthase [Tissierellia bacterium]
METKYYKLNPKALDHHILDEAVKCLKKGELVAFPTETVYGLGADGLNGKACEKIFQTKGRPSDNPLILHIFEKNQLEDLVLDLPQDINKIIENFWPGPLTIILKRKGIIPDIVTAGGDTVGIRYPKSPIAQGLLAKLGHPIAAPSANLSGKPSPTTGEDCLEDLEGKIPMILDGGPTSIGIESTVLDLTVSPYRILRPGFYTKEDFSALGIETVYDKSIIKDGHIPKSPGQKYKHYAPKAQVTVFVGDETKRLQGMQDEIHLRKNQKIGLLLFEEHLHQFQGLKRSLGRQNHLEEMAQLLFFRLREMDRLGVDEILIEGINQPGLGISIMNRLKKSAGGRMKVYEEERDGKCNSF